MTEARAFKVGLVQLQTGLEPERNLRQARLAIREAAARGAAYVLTPEVSNIFDTDKQRLAQKVGSEDKDISVSAYRQLAEELRLWLQAGSFALKNSSGQLVNRSLLFSPAGEIVARYDKIHLFDVDLANGDRIRESDHYAPGDVAVTADLPWARLGLSICYDVRFPQLYTTLAKAGAGVMTVPAAFTVPTGRVHWHVLLRARAIETGSFVLAAAQAGQHESGRATYGHSLAVNPWGEVIAEAGGDGPEVLVLNVEPAQVTSARQQIPVLRNARNFTLGHDTSKAKAS